MAFAAGLLVRITGQVQGLGFRPWVYRLARRMGVAGTVANTGGGVVVRAHGASVRRFVQHLKRNPPPLARYTSFVVLPIRLRPAAGFSIVVSSSTAAGGVEVLPDLAICPSCRREITTRTDRRYGYPFTNCTRCGPRYTIIERLPYDRPNTTMHRFRMCPACAAEYADPLNRRFHAQPNACPLCGPGLQLLRPDGTPASGSALTRTARALLAGRIVAIKSLGGFQLACDATNPAAVARLRRRKNRPTKPLAVMVGGPAAATRFVAVSRASHRMLIADAAPILLLPKLAAPSLPVAAQVAPNNRTIGVMVAYTPLHIALFLELSRLGADAPVLVMTSANRREDPITVSASEVHAELDGTCDLILDHDREIANRADDSVLSPECGPVFLRRARGYAPTPIPLAPMFHVKHPVLAVGPDGKNCLCLAAGDRAYLSPHIGGIATARAAGFWRASLERLCDWTGIRPRLIACDMHPDYLTTRLAEQLSKELSTPLVRVQHHHAHILSVMAEHGLGGPVLGLAFDGTGYGTDGTIWGCEFLSVDAGSGWRRLGHLDHLRLAGAGAEIADPGRVAAAYLAQAGLTDAVRSHGLVPVPTGGVSTSSLGRLFDAVAGITGVCRRATFDGEAPMALEAAAAIRERGSYSSLAVVDDRVSPARLRPLHVIRAVSRETLAGVPAALVAARFQNTLVESVVALTRRLCANNNLTTVCLSGGSFLNLRLRRGVMAALRRSGLTVHANRQVPTNDGGVALGQAVACRSATKKSAGSALAGLDSQPSRPKMP